MVIETTRENGISPSGSKHIEKKKGPETEFRDTKKMKGLNWGRQIRNENEKKTLGTMEEE